MELPNVIKNKCRICKKEFESIYKLHFCDDCWNDSEKMKKYREKLEKKRKYKRGETITSLDELTTQEFVYFDNKIYHIAWVYGWRIGWVGYRIKQGRLRKAIKKEEEI